MMFLIIDVLLPLLNRKGRPSGFN